MDTRDLIQTATERLGELLRHGKVDVDLEPPPALEARWRPDARITLEIEAEKYVFDVETKRHLNVATAAWLAAEAEQVQLGNGGLLLVTEHVRPAVAEVLQEHRVSYVDAAGNCHIERPPLLIHVEGRKRVREGSRKRVRAFNGEGLKLISALLLCPELVSRSYRDLADLSGASHGVVQYTMKDLEKLGFIVRMGRTQRRIRNATDLVDRWAEGFSEALRPKLGMGTFRFLTEGQLREWDKIKLDPAMDRWGGEPAAALITGYLKPARLTLYTRESRSTIMKKLRVVPDADGRVEIVRTFWTRRLEEELGQEFPGGTVPPLLVYADLAASNDPRNAEVAAMLRDRIQPG